MAAANNPKFQCNLCSGLLRDPITLPCQHSFCLKCLQALPADKQVACPKCNKFLPADYRPAKDIELMKEMDKEKLDFVQQHVGKFNDIRMEELTPVKVLGQGAFGKVVLCKYKGQDVAVKQLLIQQFTRDAIQSFIHELHMMNLVHHRNIVRFLGASVVHPRIIVTEYLPGRSVWDYLRSINRAPPRDRGIQIALDIARGMEYLHSRNILHRDLKSMNVLLDAQGTAKLCDFGLSKIKTESIAMTTGIGTPQWMSPELLMHEPYNFKADSFAFGVVLWELLTGMPPFMGMKQMEVGVHVVRGGRPKIPPQLKSDPLVPVMERCWVHNPADRPDFTEIIKILEEIQKENEKASKLSADMQAMHLKDRAPSPQVSPNPNRAQVSDPRMPIKSPSMIPAEHKDVCKRPECGETFDLRAPEGCKQHDRGAMYKWKGPFKPAECFNCGQKLESKPGCLVGSHRPSKGNKIRSILGAD